MTDIHYFTVPLHKALPERYESLIVQDTPAGVEIVESPLHIGVPHDLLMGPKPAGHILSIAPNGLFLFEGVNRTVAYQPIGYTADGVVICQLVPT